MIDTQVLGSLYEGRIAMEASLGQDELLPRCKTFHKLFDVLRKSAIGSKGHYRFTRRLSGITLVPVELLSLSHQLETLFQQAKELEASEWAGNLRVKMSPDRKSFAMTYWSWVANEPIVILPAERLSRSCWSGNQRCNQRIFPVDRRKAMDRYTGAKLSSG
jgi:hypothetical protein